MKRILGTMVLMLLAAAPGFPQDGNQAREKEQARPADTPQTPKPAAQEQPKPQEVKPNEGLMANVRIELTITDQRGDAPSVSKTVSLVTTDRTPSRVRTRGDILTPGMGPRPVILNVDARPMILPRDRVRLELTIEYQVPGERGDTASEKATAPSVNESLSVILEEGKPLLISQSADPLTDRRVKVEAKVTILR